MTEDEFNSEKKCVFIGHRDSMLNNDQLKELEDTIACLHLSGYYHFAILGWTDSFDNEVFRALRNYRQKFYDNGDFYSYDRFRIIWVCPYVDVSTYKVDFILDCDGDIFMPECCKCPPSVGIPKRNKYLADNLDFLVCFVHRSKGGASKMLEMVKKKNKQYLNLAEHHRPHHF